MGDIGRATRQLPPSGGGGGRGGQRGAAPPQHRSARVHPLPNPPPQGGRAHTERASLLLKTITLSFPPARTTRMIIDIYTHILPERFFREMSRVSPRLETIGAPLR